MRTIELGVTITDAALDDQVTVVFCDLLADGPGRCPSCGNTGTYRDTIVRTVTDLPVAGHPLQLRVRVPRYRCASASCEREVFRHNTDRLARPGWSTTRRCARHILRRLMFDRTSVAAIARELGLSWDTVNAIATWATTTLLAADPARLESVRVIGVDEHRWAHTRGAAGDGYVTVIVDLTPVFDGTGPARLLDLVPDRSSAVLTTWLDRQSAAFRDRIEVVAMDGFGGHKHAATSTVPDAVTVMDPFHVVALAGTKLDLCRQRVQQHTRGHRGRSGDPLYGVRRAARTRQELLTGRQRRRLEAVFAEDRHLPFAVTWRVYQDVIDAYADHDRRRGKTKLTRVIDTIRTGVPGGLDELAQLGRTLQRRRADVLAYFEYRASNGPTEAINGRLEALRRHALGFRNLLHYRIWSLLHCGNLTHAIDAL
ncbi:ISL3 family transposase [Rhodococcus aetherivorans]|uniref:ISL3 family transposase n=1 Tax=Rhodococcus aetherivorans TaxID=191292 RepID=UPI002949CE19|nr:ISL3 family transposase [Rhodococcus aetherivorans]MDV6297225.1 ISL3 family transposase [Rhodococcus aetherivorans]